MVIIRILVKSQVHTLSQWLLVIFSMGFGLGSCTKNEPITDPSAEIIFSVDTLRLDTVFTSSGSITRLFTVKNPNNRPILLQSISLAGGSASSFQININGRPTAAAQNVLLNANDSIYVFVKALINPNNQTAPFVVSDSILFAFNGGIKKAYLEAYGRNARYITSGTIATNTVWNNELPYVITKPLEIAPNATLTIQPGTEIYCSASGVIYVNGSLQCLGLPNQWVRFSSVRLDAPYSSIPGTWPGLVFSQYSKTNLMANTQIQNAYRGITAVGGSQDSEPKLWLQQVAIQNCYDAALYGMAAHVRLENCLLAEAGNDDEGGQEGHTVNLKGGKYVFNFCTIATHSSFFQRHKGESLFASNSNAGLSLACYNSIIAGVGTTTGNEFKTQKEGANSWAVDLSHTVVSGKALPTEVNYQQTILVSDVLFDSINTSSRFFNYRLKPNSPAIDFALPGNVSLDLQGNLRIKPDAGCYEYYP